MVSIEGFVLFNQLFEVVTGVASGIVIEKRIDLMMVILNTSCERAVLLIYDIVTTYQLESTIQ